MNDCKIISKPDDWKAFIEATDRSSIVVLADENTSKDCLPIFLELFLGNLEHHLLLISSGESNKTMETAENIWSEMVKLGVDRSSLLICLGGGMLCDLGGFAASAFKRGIRTIYVPTTNLAMTDAAIGGKTGLNFQGAKNQIGSFHLPEAVLLHVPFLETLEERQVISGYAETIKHALVSDPQLWTELAKRSFGIKDESLIHRSMNIKLNIVASDFSDTAARQALNFGHTIGHALEGASQVNEHPLLHGEAVAAGLVAESWLSNEKCGLSDEHFDAIVNHISSIYAKLPLDNLEQSTVLDFMKLDKKNYSGSIICSLISNIGSPVLHTRIEEDELLESLHVAFEKMSE